jgi:hypothetical protein
VTLIELSDEGFTTHVSLSEVSYSILSPEIDYNDWIIAVFMLPRCKSWSSTLKWSMANSFHVNCSSPCTVNLMTISEHSMAPLYPSSEFPESNMGLETGSSDYVFAFLLSLSILVLGGYLKLDNDTCFFSRYLQFNLHWSSSHSILYNLSYSRRYQNVQVKWALSK